MTGLISGGEGVKTGEALLSAEVRADGVVLFFAPLTFFFVFFCFFFLVLFFYSCCLTFCVCFMVFCGFFFVMHSFLCSVFVGLFSKMYKINSRRKKSEGFLAAHSSRRLFNLFYCTLGKL